MIVVGIVLSLVLLAFAIWFVVRLVDTLRNGLAPDIATPYDCLETIYQALALHDNSVLYEPGCGDARVLVYCASRQLNAKFVGLENGVLAYMKAKWHTRGLGNVTILFGDMRKTKPASITHIYAYLLPEALDLLMPTTAKGTRVVSCQFQFTHKKPAKVVPFKPAHKLAKLLYVYTF